MNSIRRLWYSFQLHYLKSPSSLQQFECLKGVKKCIVFLAADYGNLGDVAITKAQTEFLQKSFSGYKVVELPISETITKLKALKHVCGIDDVITIVGGGNMGDLYFDIELLRLLVVRNFPNNEIISFPQTIDYSETKEGKYLLKLTKSIYCKHKRIKLCAREWNSYNLLKEYYADCNIILAPDIVMTLNRIRNDNTRRGVTFCLRDDKEKNVETSFMANKLRTLFATKHINTSEYDTHIGNVRLSIEEREKELNKIWDQFGRSKLVVTDRLHGMIFAFITGTPAIVFDNNNGKVAQCYQWIKSCGYIYFVNDKETLYEYFNLIDDSIDTSGFYRCNKKLLRRVGDIFR